MQPYLLCKKDKNLYEPNIFSNEENFSFGYKVPVKAAFVQ